MRSSPSAELDGFSHKPTLSSHYNRHLQLISFKWFHLNRWPQGMNDTMLKTSRNMTH